YPVSLQLSGIERALPLLEPEPARAAIKLHRIVTPRGIDPRCPAARASLRGPDPQNRALVLVGHDVQQAVRTLRDVADALAQLDEQALAAQLLEVLIEQHAIEPAGARNLAVAQAADEQIAFPFRKRIAGVERKARYRDCGRPIHDRRLVARMRRAFVARLPWARIRAAEADERPAVVQARTDHVDL